MNDSTPPARIPNLFHFFFFLALTIFAFIPSEGLVLLFRHGTSITAALLDQRRQTIATVLTYAIALASAYLVMPVLWHRPFPVGLSWNAAKVRPWLALAGLLVGFAAQGIDVLFPVKNDLPIEQIFRSPGAIWFLAFFGVIAGPLFEEVLFRGFLLPAIAIAVDWMRIPRDPDPLLALDNLAAWRAGEDYSTIALLVSSIVTSILFVSIHGPQLAWTWSAMGLLMVISLLLCAVRIKTKSVAASALMHTCYNLSVFVSLFVATSGFRHLEKM